MLVNQQFRGICGQNNPAVDQFEDVKIDCKSVAEWPKLVWKSVSSLLDLEPEEIIIEPINADAVNAMAREILNQ